MAAGFSNIQQGAGVSPSRTFDRKLKDFDDLVYMKSSGLFSQEASWDQNPYMNNTRNFWYSPALGGWFLPVGLDPKKEAEDNFDKFKTIYSTVGAVAKCIPEVGAIIEGGGIILDLVGMFINMKKPAPTEPEKQEEKKVRHFEDEIFNWIKESKVQDVQLFHESFIAKIRDWQKADRFTKTDLEYEMVIQEVYDALKQHTGDAGQVTQFDTTLTAIKDSCRFSLDDHTVELAIAVMNLYTTTMFLECILASNFYKMYSDQGKDSEATAKKWRRVFLSKLQDIAAFLDRWADTFEEWIDKKRTERLSKVGSLQINWTSNSETLVDTRGVYIVNFPHTFGFNDGATQKTFEARFDEKVAQPHAIAETDWDRNEKKLFQQKLERARSNYIEGVKKAFDDRFQVLKVSMSLYRRVASETTKFKSRCEAGEIPTGASMYDMLTGKTSNPNLIGFGGISVLQKR